MTLTELHKDLQIQHPKKPYVTDIYQPILTPLLEKDITILQIGLTASNPNLLWHSFLPNAKIHGIDDNLESLQPINSSLNRFTLFPINPTSDEILINLKPNSYELIFENYSSKPEHQGLIIVNYHKYLKNNGILIIENIQKIELAISLITIAHTTKYSKIELRDFRNISNSKDNIALVLHK